MTCVDVAEPARALAMVSTGVAFDVAILDLNMPGLDGVQLAEKIRELPAGQELPLILLSSLGAKPHTAVPHLFAGSHTKPIRANALRALLVDVLTAAAPGPSAHQSTDSAPSPQSALHVLLAEDNLVNQMVSTAMLRGLGHTVDVAADGRAALRAVQSTDYDVVFMDLHMPEMDGVEATRAIRALLPAQRQPHIVAMTASSLPEEHRACLLAGMNGLLLKPVRAAALTQTLQDVPYAATIAGRHGDGDSR
jgi:CheY-like chemotaxis protein